MVNILTVFIKNFFLNKGVYNKNGQVCFEKEGPEMYYSFDDIIFKDYLDNSLLREWILNNRYADDGVFKFFLWMFIFAAFFLFTILS